MKNLVFISCILIILFKTGNVLSNTNIFSVNNIEINKESYKNRDLLINQIFKKGFLKLIERLLLDEDYKNLSNTSLEEIKKLISHYQIINSANKQLNKNSKFNIFFDKDRMHNFFYQRNLLYSDILNTEIIFFPLLKNNDEYFIYTKNYFYENWSSEESNFLIEYNLPLENIENMKLINLYKNNIYEIDISNFFKEYNSNVMIFAIIEIKNKIAKVFLVSNISGKKLNKSILISKNNLGKDQFNNQIIRKIKNEIRDLIKSQNLIDVRTPSFLNVKIKLDNEDNLVTFKKKIEKINLINNFYIQKLNKDYVLIKIKYLGKISKIIKKLKDQDISLKMIDGQWSLNII